MPLKISKKFIRQEEKLIDKSVTFAAILYPATTIPQIIVIFKDHDTSGISIATWALYWVFSLFFLLYAIRRHLKPLILEYILWIVMEGAVVVGTIIHR